ncbi:MAG: hypothetical protein P3M72_00250 [Candidatus Hodgkinia cicadicola]|nr:MAG: hypothetical protein P3M72_00250 [Candidatus Hodgkinia cicadicola]
MDKLLDQSFARRIDKALVERGRVVCRPRFVKPYGTLSTEAYAFKKKRREEGAQAFPKADATGAFGLKVCKC